MHATALALTDLESYEPFSEVRPFMPVIQEGRHTCMAAAKRHPTAYISPRVWQDTTVWYASTILHEGYHSKLYHENSAPRAWFRHTPRAAWSGREAERACLRFQLAYLVSAGAKPSVIVWVEELIVDPSPLLIPASQRTW